MAGLQPVVEDQQLVVLRVLADRRRALGEDHTRMVAQLHHLLVDLIAGGAKKELSAAQAGCVNPTWPHHDGLKWPHLPVVGCGRGRVGSCWSRSR